MVPESLSIVVVNTNVQGTFLELVDFLIYSSEKNNEVGGIKISVLHFSWQSLQKTEILTGVIEATVFPGGC